MAVPDPADYLAQQMRGVLSIEPHRLVLCHDHESGMDEYHVVIASVAGLDAALSEAGDITGLLVGHVLPSVTLSDCRVLKEAVEAGSYRGMAFGVMTAEGDDTLDARLGASLAVDEARDARAALCAVADKWAKASPVQQGTRASPKATKTTAARARLGAEDWAKHVDFYRTDVHKQLMFAVDRLGRSSSRLDAI